MLLQPESRVSRRDRRFFVGMAIAAVATVFFGFAPTYYLKSFTHTAAYPTGLPVSPSLPALVHVHALVFSAWILLFLAQTTLIAADRPHVHRRLGIAGAVLAPFMVILGVMTAMKGGRDGWNPGGPYPDSLAFMIVGLVDVLIFAAFVTAGLYFRRRAELHKRLMLLATVGGLMWPAITRMPVRGWPADSDVRAVQCPCARIGRARRLATVAWPSGKSRGRSVDPRRVSDSRCDWDD